MTNTEDEPSGLRRAPAGGAWLAAIMIVSWTAGSGTMEMEEGRRGTSFSWNCFDLLVDNSVKETLDEQLLLEKEKQDAVED